jgi:hypothetical protein
VLLAFVSRPYRALSAAYEAAPPPIGDEEQEQSSTAPVETEDERQPTRVH